MVKSTSKVVMGTRRPWLWVVGALLLALACTAASTRPYFGPLAGARADTLPAVATTVVDALAASVQAVGFRVQAMSAQEGYLETYWFDTRAGRSGGRYARNPGAVVRLRFFVDDARALQSVVVSEVVYRTRLDPSRGEREIEALVPLDHAGMVLLDSVMHAAAARLGVPGS
jgi:hypothetical protein